MWSRQLAGRSATPSRFVAGLMISSPWFSADIFRCHIHMTCPQASIALAKSKPTSADIIPRMQRARAACSVWFVGGDAGIVEIDIEVDATAAGAAADFDVG